MDIPKVRFLLAIFLLSVTLVPAAETDWLKLAVKAHQEALYSLSNRQIENFLRTHNQDPRRDFAYLLRAVNYLQLKNFPEAESSLLKLLSDFPQSVYGREAYRYLILVRLQQGKVELAFSDYTTFGEKYGQDDNLSAQVGLALFSRGVVLFNQGERKGSREIFQKFLNAF
ncbi:MAG TPA: tetratricopeptide repeat protein, partial [bacterium]|nr:tetratricopeptide repeat protein [bacterium]